jgi:uncharacterized membrane protein HdeD (DUF308 family)
MNGQVSFKNLLYFEAILFILLGIIAIAIPQFFTIGIELLVGLLLIAAGIVQFIRLFQAKDAPGFWGSFFGAIFSLILGALFLIYPLAGVLSLTYLMILYFLIDGIAKIYFSFQLKAFQNWGWILISGIVSLALAAIIFTGLPGTAVWVLGLLVGINMLFFGFSLIGFASMIDQKK